MPFYENLIDTLNKLILINICKYLVILYVFNLENFA